MTAIDLSLRELEVFCKVVELAGFQRPPKLFFWLRHW
jgi:hypothetical protein